MRDPPAWFRSPSALVAGGGLALVVVLELVFGRLSGSPSDISLFFGRFHPLVVHLPIGVLVLVGLAEVATFSARYRARIDPALGLALPVLLVVTVTAFVLGHFLARSGGFAAQALTLHRRLEFLAVVGVCVSVGLFARHVAHETIAGRTAYRGALFVTLALLAAGAHFGGTVTHGGSYLTEYAPVPLRRLLGEAERAPAASSSAKAPQKSAEPLVFAHVVAPILEKYCVECHGAKKSKGKLRLDSLDAIMKGGEGGPAVVAGSSATSELVKRVRLPVDDDDRMPPEGKPGPTTDELAVVSFWIERGAASSLRVKDTLAPASGRKLLEAALDETPSVPGAAPPNSEERSGTPAPAASARERQADEPEKGADDSSREQRAEAEPPVEKPAVASEAPVEKPAPVETGTLNGRAILADKCQKCHGPSKKKGGLRVDSVAALVAGGENGPALVPGEPSRSEIIRRVRLPETDDEHMPPKKEPQLREAEVAALSAWVRGLSRTLAESEPSKTPAASKAASETTPTTADAPDESAQASVPADAAPAPAAESEEQAPAASRASDDGPPDEELLARVPSPITLYEDAVRPLLTKRCGKCHTGEKPAARLRIDDYRALVEGGLSGPGIVPGKPDESFVCQRISLPATDDDRMPPEDEPPMTADEIALVRFWVERGASPELSLPAKEMPAGALRAAAHYAPPSREESSLRADAGCAACAVGSSSRSSVPAFVFFGLVVGVLVFRRRSRAKAEANPSLESLAGLGTSRSRSANETRLTTSRRGRHGSLSGRN